MQEDFFRIAIHDYVKIYTSIHASTGKEVEEEQDFFKILDHELSPIINGLLYINKLHVVNELYSDRLYQYIVSIVDNVILFYFIHFSLSPSSPTPFSSFNSKWIICYILIASASSSSSFF